MWSLSILIGLPILCGLILIAIICLIVFSVKQLRGGYDFGFGYGFPIGLSLVITLLLVGFGLFAYYPYEPTYRQYRPVSGQVAQVSNRILGSGSSVQQKFVVIINGQEYGCEDTRCALVQPKDTLELSCRKVWVYGGADGYDCNFVRRIPHS